MRTGRVRCGLVYGDFTHILQGNILGARVQWLGIVWHVYAFFINLTTDETQLTGHSGILAFQALSKRKYNCNRFAVLRLSHRKKTSCIVMRMGDITKNTQTRWIIPQATEQSYGCPSANQVTWTWPNIGEHIRMNPQEPKIWSKQDKTQTSLCPLLGYTVSAHSYEICTNNRGIAL